MSCLAILPARGGSKRLPRKNCLLFCGKPLFLWSCDAARESGCFDRILVSTEDKEIADIALKSGYEVDIRPQRLATDTASTTEVCLDLLEKLERQGEYYTHIALIYPTAPLRNAEDIRQMARLAVSRDTDFVHAVTTFSGNPYQLMYQNDFGYLVPAWPLLVQKKSQELPIPYHGNGSTYFARVEALMAMKTFYGPKLKGYIMDRIRSVDIDTQEDFDLLATCSTFLTEK